MSMRQARITASLTDQDDGVIDLTDTDETGLEKAKNRKTALLHSSGLPAKMSKSRPTKASWSSFDDFGDFASSQTGSSSQTKSRKRLREEDTKTINTKPSNRRKNVANDDLWVDKHAPNIQGDLAVHKKKIQDVEDWLRHNFSKTTHRSQAPILLLTGPSGAGKTATIRVLAKEMDFEIKEWINPLTENLSEEDYSIRRDDFTPIGGQCYESQASLFKTFMIKASRYQSLPIFGDPVQSKWIVLLEDYPNIFFRDANKFQDVLRMFVKTSRCPIVCIVSDSAGGETNERLLFPKDLQAQLGICNISFNPVAQTSMTKILTRVASLEASKGAVRVSVPSKSTIDALATASAGDVRGAINALQFACQTDTRDLDTLLDSRATGTTGRKSSKKKGGNVGVQKGNKGKKGTKGKGTDALAAIGGRDNSLFLFRALGKILYCKRDEPSTDPEESQLPAHLTHRYRDPLLVNPELVVTKCQVSDEFFTAYLHQNYPEFYSDIDDLVESSQYLSDADYLTCNWESREALKEYASSVASRGIMFCNSQRARTTGTGGSGFSWKPLHKPQCYAVNRKVRDNRAESAALLKGQCWTPEDTATQLIPYLALIDTTMRSPGHISFIQEMTRFSTSKFPTRSCVEKLDENDVTLEEREEETRPPPAVATDTDGIISNSQSKVANAVANEDEDCIIEDFDDDCLW